MHPYNLDFAHANRLNFRRAFPHFSTIRSRGRLNFYKRSTSPAVTKYKPTSPEDVHLKDRCAVLRLRRPAAPLVGLGLSPSALALPSFARRTGQKCAACHVGAGWPQLTPQDRFFKLLGSTVVKLATKVINFLDVFCEYRIGNIFPGWKGTTDAADNASAGTLISSLGARSGRIGADALRNRQLYLEFSVYRAATGFFGWTSAGTSFADGGANNLKGCNPYRRAYWGKVHWPRPHLFGMFGTDAHVYPNRAVPGPADRFTDYGLDSHYQHLGATHQVTLAVSHIYENQAWRAGYLLGPPADQRK